MTDVPDGFENLESFPFCGGQSRWRNSRTKPTFYISCWSLACGAIGPEKPTLAEAIAAWNTRANSAEIAGALEQLRDLHDSMRTVYDAVPALPITVDTMDAATDALHAFCLLVGIHRVDVGDPQPQPAMQQGGGGGGE